MANGVDEGVINFTIFKDESMLLGAAEVSLPDFETEVFNVTGAGILGEIEVPVSSYFKPMTVSIKFNHANEAAHTLAVPEVHSLTLYRADQHYNYSEGVLEQKGKKIIMRVVPKKLSGGTLKSASPIEVSGEYACHYYCEIDSDGNKMCEYDPLNFRFIDHAGNDRGAEIRKCLGMA